MAEWQPIATAPRDGTEVLLWGACRPRNSGTRYAGDANVGWWSVYGWHTRVAGEVCMATHWQPLPAPPTD